MVSQYAEVILNKIAKAIQLRDLRRIKVHAAVVKNIFCMKSKN